ncbi:hypothetical protein, partial [Crocinitomix catalasitica]|uniref:hypothetical protein n=1 Tax=Crocinitomix catalasitica TaxID=184607 RepID=UPI00056964B9
MDLFSNKLFRLNFILLIAFMFLIGNYESFSQTVLPTNSSPVDDAVAPLGWTVLVGSTDISNKDFWAGWAAYPWEDSPVDPPNGHLVWVTGFYSEVVGTTITDLTVGVPYSMSFYMAEMRSNAGGPPALYDGTLKVTVGVDEFLFPFSGGLDNSWSLESLSFVATAVSMPMKFEYETAISNGNFWNISFSDDVVDEECDALTTTVSSTDVCIGDEVTLEASSENGGIIIWDGGVIDGVAFVPPVGATTYTATSDNEDDCEFSVIINVHDPDVTASVNEDVICLGETAIFTGGGADTYVWDMGVTDGVVFEPLSAGTITYTVTGTDAFGCSNTATVDLIVSPLPLINFEFIADGVSSEDGSTGGCIINPVQFNDLTNIDPPGVITEWEWRFGDG